MECRGAMRENPVKIVVFSDVHGNVDALYAMLKSQEIKNCDYMIFLGDAVGYYFEEEKVVALLKTLPVLHAVKGNHDQYYQAEANDILRDEMCRRYGPCYQQQKEQVTDWLKTLPKQGRMQIKNRTVHFFHGSPSDPLEGRIYPNTQIEERDLVADVVLCGHTHYRMCRTVQKSLFVNPGSISLPKENTPHSYVMIEEKDIIIKDVDGNIVEEYRYKE